MNISVQSKRVIVAALNWGLGHATRCIPIIQELLKDNEVAIASDGNALELLKMTFPNLVHYELPAYDIHYKYQSMVLNMAIQAPKFFSIYNQEKTETKRIVEAFNADMIISDNRFGVISKQTHNVFMTHQLNIPMGNRFMEGMADMMHHFFINQYDECWVPDDEINSLAGKMSTAKVRIPKKYIGVLSRLEKKNIKQDIDVLAVLSGPEPQRTNLEKLLLDHLDTFGKNVVLVRGTNNHTLKHTDVEIYNLLAGDKLNDLINRSKLIICRSGYTSLMDLRKLEKKALLIPTPGQYEQEYLANQLDGKNGYLSMSQYEINKISLQNSIECVLKS